MDNSDIIENKPEEVNREFKQRRSIDSNQEQEQEPMDQSHDQEQNESEIEDIQQEEQHEEEPEKNQHKADHEHKQQTQDKQDTDRKKSRQLDELDAKYKTPKQDIGSSRDMYSTQTKDSKKSTSKQNAKKKINQKNFLEENLKVKTLSDIKQEKSLHKRRQSETSSHQRLSSLLQMRQSLLVKGYKGRLEDWDKMLLNDSIMSVSKPTQSGQKNQSNEFVVKHIEISLEDIQNQGSRNNLGGSFSKNKKEKAYHQTNSSSITMLNSYKSLEFLDKPEYKVIPQSKGNQTLKRAMNQSNVFQHKLGYIKPQDCPEGFSSHKGQKPVVHNMTNAAVQSMRWRNRQSNLFDQ